MARLFLVFCLLFSGIASAEQGDLTAQLRTVAYHFDGKSNDNVPGIGIEYEAWDRVKLGYTHGRNSMTPARYSNWFQAQYVWYRSPAWDMSAGISVADNYASRYSRNDIKTSAVIQGCHKTTERFQMCGLYHAYATGTFSPSMALVFKYKFN